jgi:hypothetical protein
MAPINSEYLQYDPENDNLFPIFGCNIQQIASHAQGIKGFRQKLAYVEGCLCKLWNDYSEKDDLAAGRAFESLEPIATRLKFKIQLGEVDSNTTPGGEVKNGLKPYSWKNLYKAVGLSNYEEHGEAFKKAVKLKYWNKGISKVAKSHDIQLKPSLITKISKLPIVKRILSQPNRL